MNQVIPFLVLGLACATISYTITKGSIFSSLRMWVLDRSIWLGKLVQCPYCTSHWIALGAMLIFHPRMIDSGFAFTDYLATGFALTGLSALGAGAIFKLFYTKEG